MATARKLPSGNWRCRAYDSETKKEKSFTAPTKKEAEKLAADWTFNHRAIPVTSMTLDEAIQQYIRIKSNVLSPTTLEKYDSIRRVRLSPKLLAKPVQKISSVMLQEEINRLSATLSPKSISNTNGLIMSVLHMYCPDTAYNVTLPQKRKRLRELPAPEIIFDTFRDTDIWLEVLLAMCLGLRMSEIRGLRKSDFRNGKVYVERAIVTVNQKPMLKPYPKTTDSFRSVSVPQFISDIVEQLPTQNITERSGVAVYKYFKRRIVKAGYPDTTFHDLRHINASVMLQLGIADKYAMERGGWSSTAVMKSIYQETFKSERERTDDKINGFFESLATNTRHEKN